MASTRINSIDLGPIWLQSGNGIPDHLAYLGTQYTDLNNALIYSNIDGMNTWSALATTSVIPYDKYITGMTFNNANYDLSLGRNDGVVFTQNLGILASDMTVTGGTYNSSTGTATFVNNSGGTFSVTGFITGFTDSYTTGATLSGNAITFGNSTLGPNYYNVDLSPILLTKFDKSGGTINGSVISNSFIKSGGTASQFLKADGSSDNTIYQSFISSGLTTDYYRGDKTFQPLTTGVVSEVINKRYVTDLDLVHLSGLSGINTGDNAVNTTSNAYADAKVQDIIVDGVSGIAPSQNVVYDKLLLKQNLPTGFISGLPLTIKPLDNTKAIIGNGTYAITDFSVLSAITVQLVSVTTPIEFTPAFLLTNPASYIALDINQNVIQSSSPFTNEDRRTLALIGAVIHSNNININTTNEIKAPIVGPTNQLHDMIKAVGALNLEGNIYSPNGANLQLNKSSGTIWGLGINSNDHLNPHVLSLSAQTSVNFNYRLRNSFQYSGTTSVDPDNYDNGGVLTAVPNNRYTIQRINLFQSGISILQYGQNIYQTLDEAKTFLSTESFVTEQNIADNAIFRAYLILKKGITNLTSALSANDAFFVPVDKFGNTVGGGSLATLQSAYDNSITPEIVTNSSSGGLSIRNGAGTPNSATTLFEGVSSGGTVNSRITASGSFSGTSFIVSGGTASQFLKANGTLDSTTYLVSADISGKENKSEKGVPNGYTPLDSNNKVPLVHVNDALLGNVKWYGLYNGSVISSSPVPSLNGQVLPTASSGNTGWYFISSSGYTNGGKSYEIGDWIISNGIIWDKVDNTDTVSSVFGRVGVISAQTGDYTTAQVTEVTNKRYQTDLQNTYNDATSSIQTQLNSKQPLLTNPITGIGTLDRVSKWSSVSGQTDSDIYDNSNGIGFGLSVFDPYSLSTLNQFTFKNKTINENTRVNIVGNGTAIPALSLGIDSIRHQAFSLDSSGNLQIAMNPNPSGVLLTEVVKILKNGNTGFGVTNPIGKLDIFTASGNTVSPANQTSGSVSVGNLGGGSVQVPSVVGKSDNSTGLLLMGTSPESNSNSDMRFDIRENNNTDFTNRTTIGFEFTRFGTKLFDILRNGNATFTGNLTAPTFIGSFNGNATGLSLVSATDANTNNGVGTNTLNSTTGAVNFPYAAGISLDVRRATGNLSAVGSYQLWSGNNPNDTDLQFRKIINYSGGEVWSVWQKMLHGGNFRNYALPLSGGTATGAIFAPTATLGTNNTQVATTAYVQANSVGGTGTSGQVSFWNGTNSQGGDNSLFWDNTNKTFGIGTTNHVGRFNVTIGTTNTYSLATQDDNSISITNAGAGVGAPAFVSKTTTNGLRFISGTNDVNSVFDMNFDVRRTDNTDFTGFTTSAFRFTRGGTTRLMDILRDGKVGFGTTSAPIAKLQVVDTNGGFFFDGSNVTYNRIKSTGVASTTGKDLLLTAQSGGTNPDLYLTNDSKIGIGTSAPIGKLDIITGSINTYSPTTQADGSISFSNASSTTFSPTMNGKSNNGVGLFLGSATSENNVLPDMVLNVRKSNNTDYTTLTTPAFRFSRFSTVLVDILRNGNTTFTGSVQASQFKLSALNTAPATATSAGVLGEIRIVNGFIYVCVATNVWQRAALLTF